MILLIYRGIHTCCPTLYYNIVNTTVEPPCNRYNEFCEGTAAAAAVDCGFPSSCGQRPRGGYRRKRRARSSRRFGSVSRGRLYTTTARIQGGNNISHKVAQLLLYEQRYWLLCNVRARRLRSKIDNKPMLFSVVFLAPSYGTVKSARVGIAGQQCTRILLSRAQKKKKTKLRRTCEDRQGAYLLVDRIHKTQTSRIQEPRRQRARRVANWCGSGGVENAAEVFRARASAATVPPKAQPVFGVRRYDCVAYFIYSVFVFVHLLYHQYKVLS